MKQYLLKTIQLTLIFVFSNTLLSQATFTEIPLWTTAIPNAIDAKDYIEAPVVREGVIDDVSKVSIPTLAVFAPEKPNGTSVVMCPGGGYAFLAINKEGYKAAKWLNSLGITVFVLKYRLPSDKIMKDKTIGPLQDAQESIRYIRRNALKYNLNVDKIGIAGFSAGGHLAATLSTHYNDNVYPVSDEISAKPNFSILIYPVISMEESLTHKGSRNNLLGNNPTPEIIKKYSNETQVDAQTPPTYIVHATDDKTVIVENSLQYYLALRKNNVKAEMHLYETGKHGFGLGKIGSSKNWTKQCEDWLLLNNF